MQKWKTKRAVSYLVDLLKLTFSEDKLPCSEHFFSISGPFVPCMCGKDLITEDQIDL